MGISKSGNNIRLRSLPNDVIFTPEGLALDLINEIGFTSKDYLLDPFKGEGAFFNQFGTNKKEWCEINEGRDFFKRCEIEKADWIISNPPFSLITPILQKSMKCCKIGFGYIMPSYALTYPRILMCEKEGFRLSKIVYFKNPKEWGFGFQCHFVIFQRTDFLPEITIRREN